MNSIEPSLSCEKTVEKAKSTSTLRLKKSVLGVVNKASDCLLVVSRLFLAASVSLVSCVTVSEYRGPVCGDGKEEGHEECDDGNRWDGDGCSSNCYLESGDCGDGVCDPLIEDGATCARDCFCGDGVVDSTEECEPGFFSGRVCSDFESCTGGTLSCDESYCLLDFSGCECLGYCGDGVLGQDEECDDGNKTDGDGCDANCKWENECGNGVVEGGEECDCGTDPDQLPQGCEGVNGDLFGSCAITCEERAPCSTPPFEVCDTTEENDCCPDFYGNEYSCIEGELASPLCLAECEDTSDCYYGMYCKEGTAGGFCYFALCGPTGDPLVGSEFHAPCTIPGGGEGYCVPHGFAEDGVGVCVESGESGHGETCDYVSDSQINVSYQPRTMTWNRCDSGICLEEAGNVGGGKCSQLCNWEDSFEGNDTCPTGHTCLPFSTMDSDPNDPDAGLRKAEIGKCITRDIDSSTGIITCDLVTGEALPDRSDTCAQYNTDPTDNYVCEPVIFQDGIGFGTPVGHCVNLGEEPNVAVWDECTYSDTCPAGSACIPELTTDLGSQRRCVPYCHTENDDCSTRGDVPPDTVCQSLSSWYVPGSTQGSSLDGSPSVLGCCVCPEGGCGG